MKVDNDLIKKYHLNLCTEEEKALVEEWLLNDETEEVVFASQQDKDIHKEEMWQSLTAAIPALQAEPKRISLSHYFTRYKYQAIAASLLFGTLVTGAILFRNSTQDSSVAIASSAGSERKEIDMTELCVTLAPKSKASIKSFHNAEGGNIDFCGTIMINPKKDFKLTINGSCASSLNAHDGVETVNLKKGHTYIAVNYRFNQENELIIVNEQNLSNLPPMLQKEIMNQFSI